MPIYWPGQTVDDWYHYDQVGSGVWVHIGNGILALDSDDGDPIPIQRKFSLAALDICNPNPARYTPDTAPELWAHPLEFAKAAELVAAALANRDPDAQPMVRMEATAGGRRDFPPDYVFKDEQWDRLQRNFAEAARIARRLAADGIELVTLDEGWDGWTADPDDEYEPEI